jgi:hypothetical protein
VVGVVALDGVGGMNQQAAAIIIAVALIAVAIMLTSHWSVIVLDRPPAPSALRLNRWTGTVVICGGEVREGWELPCPNAFPVPKARQ